MAVAVAGSNVSGLFNLIAVDTSGLQHVAPYVWSGTGVWVPNTPSTAGTSYESVYIKGTGTQLFAKVTASGELVVMGSVYQVNPGGAPSNVFVSSGAFTPSITSTGSVSSIVGGSENTLVSVVLSGSNYILTGWDATGTSDARFIIYTGSPQVMRDKARICAANQNVNKVHSMPIRYTNIGSVVLKVIHSEDTSQSFEGFIHGYEG